MWFEIISKVMKLWTGGEVEKSKSLSDADDFYVFLYDEEDKQKQ